MSDSSVEHSTPPIHRSGLIRDAVVFQLKLAIDGVIDLLLLPVSMVGALISFFTGRQTFYEVVRAGHSLDRRLNLFGAADRQGGTRDDHIEALARRLETELRREYDQGHLRASARAAIDRLVRAVRKTG